MNSTGLLPIPSISENLRAIDWILRRLAKLQDQFPARARELAPRIDGALDERLRLMRLRDLARACHGTPFPNHEQN